MTDKGVQDTSPMQNTTDVLKSWMMVALTLIFVLLYASALLGWLKPLADVTMITRLEPIIFVIIGYYFGRLPAQQNEKTLKDEIKRQTQKADASQNAKEQAKLDREALEEKVKNARVVLTTSSETQARSPSINSNDNNKEIDSHAVNSAISILSF